MPTLDIKYFAQNDNTAWVGYPGSVQCAPTSYAALAYYLRPELFPSDIDEPETYYKIMFEATGYTADDRGNHQAHVETLAKQFNIKGHFTTEATLGQVTESLDKGFPVVLPLNYKKSGHVVLAVGYSDKGLLINDPYGVRHGSAHWYDVINDGTTSEGERDLYSWTTLEAVAFDYSNYCWAYLPSESQDPPVSLPKHLDT